MTHGAVVGSRCRRRGRGVLALVALTLAVSLAAGCTASDSDEPVPDSVPAITVGVGDRDLTVDGAVPAGRVVFNIRNTGENTHRLVLFPLADDRPPIHDDIADDVERPMQVTAGVPPLEPGDTATFAVDLAGGQRYGMVDTIEVDDGPDHMELGVATEFRTKTATSPSPPASPTPTPSPPAGG